MVGEGVAGTGHGTWKSTYDAEGEAEAFFDDGGLDRSC